MARSRKKLGDILVGWGVLTPDQVNEAVAKAKSSNKRLGDTIIELGFASDEAVTKALANQFAVEYVDLANSDIADKIDPTLIPEDLIRKHLVLPLTKSMGKMQVIIHDPLDLELLDLLQFRLSAQIEPRLASRAAVKKWIDTSLKSGKSPSADQAPQQDKDGKPLMTASIDRSMDKSIDIAADEAPIVRLVQRILSEAVRMRASDIHFEPFGDRLRLRYRIDGVCMERDNLPKRMQNSILSRVKLMAGMNIAEKRLPQDGRIKISMIPDPAQPVGPNNEQVFIDFRVSACPVYHGESIVLRILRPDSVKIGLSNLGFEDDNLAVFNKIIRRPNGIFLVTGPTGSGKTTTLYSALDVLNRPDKKIITAEDPIEYNFRGINQCQTREKIGLTFSIILKTMLRQAPNIILVGEIRDREVAEIAIQAALTGHLVFSTLHTNDAPSAITRLIDMGVKPFLVASAIQAIMAQRLIRVLCPKCKAVDPEPDPKYLALTNITPDEARGKVLKAVGCDNCNGAGYRGRKAIFEMMQMTSEIRELAFRQEPIAKIRQAALAGGMRALVDDGKIKILKGVTTPDEVARSTQVEMSTL